MGTDWPEEFGTIRENQLRSNMFDEELMPNRGNANVQPSLFQAFNRQRPQLYAQRAALYAASQEICTSGAVEEGVSIGADVATSSKDAELQNAEATFAEDVKGNFSNSHDQPSPYGAFKKGGMLQF